MHTCVPAQMQTQMVTFHTDMYTHKHEAEVIAHEEKWMQTVIILSDLSPSQKEKYHSFFLVCGSYILHRHINHICTYKMSIEAIMSMRKGCLKVGVKRHKGKVVGHRGYAQSTLYIGYY